jgi:hypothetical protein
VGKLGEGTERARACEDALAEARLDGAQIAGRTAQHFLNNQLALVVGYIELLEGDSALPPHLRIMAQEALRGARAASKTVNRLSRVTVLAFDRSGANGPPILDLKRSTEPDEPA